MLTWDEYRQIRYKYFGEKRPESRKNYRLYKEMKTTQAISFQFGVCTPPPLVTACEAPAKKSMFKRPANSITESEVTRAIDWLQEGNNPMCYNKTPDNQKTEAQTQREYLDKRLSQAAFEKNNSLQKTFKINNPDHPKTYKELIDAIKNDKFEVDKKVAARIDDYVEEEGHFYGSAFEGIKWKLDDAPDWDGYHDATAQAEAKKTTVRDAIFSGVYADGLKALQDFEAWQPTGKAN